MRSFRSKMPVWRFSESLSCDFQVGTERVHGRESTGSALVPVCTQMSNSGMLDRDCLMLLGEM